MSLILALSTEVLDDLGLTATMNVPGRSHDNESPVIEFVLDVSGW
jgi:hypothetical protein